MSPALIIVGSGLAVLLGVIFIWWLILRVAPNGKKLTISQVNKRAAGTLLGILIGLPAIWALSLVIIQGFIALPPFGQLLLWGGLGVLALLLGAFAIIRAAILKAVNA